MSRVLAALVAAALGPWAPAALASTYDIFGFTARDVAMGSAMTSAARGYSALYYNPAGLTTHGQQHIGLGLTLTLPDLYIDRARRGSGHPSVTPDPHVGLSLGWLKPIPGVFEERLAIAFGVYLPAQRIVRIEGVDPQSPHFYLYQNLQDKMLLHGGLAFEAYEWLSVGAGVQILADLGGRVSLDMDVVAGRFERRELSVSLNPTASLFAGVLLTPTDGLSLGLSYRGKSALAFDLPVTVDEGEALGIAIGVSQTVLWTPHQVSLGMSAVLADPKLRIALDATWALWSEAPDPSPRLSVDFTGGLLDAFGLAQALDLSTRTEPIAMGLSDTLIARAGLEWEAAPWIELRGGYFYRPTPLPKQSAATAYLDNDAHVVAIGAGVLFKDPLLTRQSFVELDVAAQLTLLPRRTVQRVDRRDPIGGLSHGGALWTVTTTVSHSY